MYYSTQKLLSHNAFISFVMSGRGMGKSYESKAIIIRTWEKYKKQCVYVRRKESEFKELLDVFWSDIQPNYPEYELTVKGNTGYIDGEPVVFFIALSTSTNKKSIPYPNVKYIIFDEYIVTKSRYNNYLQNEMVLFLDLIETVGRKRPDLRVIMLSNSVSYVCPFFTFFDIEIKPNKRFQKFHDNYICVESFESESFTKEKIDTPFAKLLQYSEGGRQYSNYAIGNQTLEDNNDFIGERKGELVFSCSFKTDNFEVGCWFNRDTLGYFVDEKIDKSSKKRYALLHEDIEPGIKHIKEYRNTWNVKDFKSNFNKGNVIFINQEVKKFVMNYVAKYI